LLLVASSLAADSKAVSYESGDETVRALLYTPSGKGPFPGIVVIHEWWGLNEWVKEQAAKLADEGYAELAIFIAARSEPRLTRPMRLCAACLKIVPSATCMRPWHSSNRKTT